MYLTRISIVDIWAAISKILTRSLPERTTPAPSFALVTPTSTCCLSVKFSWVPCVMSAGCGGNVPSSLQLYTAMYTNCYRLPTRFSIVQCCAQRGLVLCQLYQRGAKIVQTRCQDCANELPRLCSVVPVRFSIVRVSVLCKAV